MKRIHASMLPCSYLVPLLFVVVATARATVFSAVAVEPNACGPQMDYAPVVPFSLPAWEPNEPNEAPHAVLGPIPGDSKVWTAPAGPFKRPHGRACDPNGLAFTIRYLRGTGPVEVQHDRTAELWTFSTPQLHVGPNYFEFEADNGYRKRRVRVAIEGVVVDGPVLE